MWLFQPVVNACIQILLCIASGFALAHLRIISSSDFVPQASALVLNLCFPCLNLYYLGIQTNLSDRGNWLILSASLTWTIFTQISILVVVFLLSVYMLKYFGDADDDSSDEERQSDLTARIRAVALINLCLTSDNTVLVGLPLVTAVFGEIGARASLLTMFPIFVLAIPFSIYFFEWERARASNEAEEIRGDQGIEVRVADRISDPRIEPSVEVSISSTVRLMEPQAKGLPGTAIIRKILKNPLLWSLGVAILVSISTVGPKYLNPSSPSYIAELGWIASTTRTIAAVAVPLSLVSQGAWMYTKPLTASLRANPRSLWPLLLILVARSILLPLLMLVICRYIVGLDPESGMSLVLLSVCPIASSCFVLAVEYGRGQSLVTTLTVIGTLLLLPLSLFILYLPRALGIWDYVMVQN